MASGDRLEAEVARLRRQPLRRRNWPLVRRLGAVTAALLVASLVVGEYMRMPGFAAFTYFAAVATGAAMFIHAFDRRLFINKPPVE